MKRTLPCFLVALSLFAGTRTARAGDPAAAEALFREARELIEAGKIDQACTKFHDSQKLDPSSGTLLNLADCHLKQGKSATAWAEFLEAERLARSQGKTLHQEEAARRARALESDLAYLTIRVEAPSAGLEVKRGDALVPSATFETPLPVDPGTVVVTATSPGYRPFRVSVTVSPLEEKTIVVPKLVPESGAAAPPGAGEPRDRPPPHILKIPPDPSETHVSALPWIPAGIGIAALGVGGVFGALALSSNGEAEDACPTRSGCSKKAVDAAERRDTQATIANVGVGVGIVGLAVAGGWYWIEASGGGETRGEATMRGVRVNVATGRRGATVGVVGRF